MSDQLRLQGIIDCAKARDAATALARFQQSCGCSSTNLNPNVPNEAAYLEGKVKACGFNYSRDSPVSSGTRTARVQKAAADCGPQKPRRVIEVRCPYPPPPPPPLYPPPPPSKCALPNTPLNPVLPA